MRKIRIIPRLDVKGPNVVKGIQLEGLRIVGNPAELAKKYYEQGADEILYIDIVASLYNRNNLIDVVKKTSEAGVFIPMTVGGGIRSVDDVRNLLRAGADKVAINTSAVRNPELITESSKIFGSQCIVGSIEAKFKGGKWEVYIDNGRECTGLDVMEWAKRLVELGVGEILLTSIDRDGTKRGFDLDLIKKIRSEVNVPLVVSGGAGSEEDILQCSRLGCDGISFGSILHYNLTSITLVKNKLFNHGVNLRPVSNNLIIPKNKIKKSISIVDYGVGNLKSVITAFQSLGNEVRIVDKPSDILDSELLVLPGDGAFGYGMEELNKRNLVGAINEYVSMNKPLLGICLGMQLLMTESEEFGHHRGLNLIEGRVIMFKARSTISDEDYTIPHMGWNSLISPDNLDWKGSILDGLKNRSEVYFIHSYYVTPNNPDYSVANAIYGGQDFCAVIRKGNIFGTQFHPEKSGSVGMTIIKNFCEL